MVTLKIKKLPPLCHPSKFNKKQDLPSPTQTKQDCSGLLLPHLPCKKCILEHEHSSYPFIPNANYKLKHVYLHLAFCHVMSLQTTFQCFRGFPGTLRISSLFEFCMDMPVSELFVVRSCNSMISSSPPTKINT